MSFDIVTYALLKKRMSGGIASTKIENGHLILVGTDGTEYDCGDLGIPTIDDENVSSTTIWSSQKIMEAIPSEEAIAQIAKETNETYDYIIGGTADFNETDILIATGEVNSNGTTS